MDFSAIKDLYIGPTPVQQAWLNGSKVWGRKTAVDEQSIRDAMILWYDLKKQGATNGSMASTPELVNHAYDPDKANVIDWTQFSTRGDGVQQFSIEITSTTNYWVVNQAAYHRTNSIPSFYVEVANLPEGHTINYFYGDGSDERQTYVVSYNGIHKIPACRVSPNVTTATGWFIDPNNPTGQTVSDLVGTTITQVNPTFNATCYNFAWTEESGISTTNYPNSLVSDGVDDYCLVKGLPLLNKEDGYTVIAKRKRLSNMGCLASKRDYDNSLFGAFQFEYSIPNRHLSLNFGLYTDIEYVQQDISWMTSQQYNNTSIRIGTSEDADIMCIFTSYADDYYRTTTALYSLLLFNRDLTTEEIEWVKTNLIETEQ